MNNVDEALELISKLDDNKDYDPQVVVAALKVIALELLRLRQMEVNNRPILRSAMMHMPFGVHS